jgi:hypothetical protein
VTNNTQTPEKFNHPPEPLQGPIGAELFVHFDQPQLSSDAGLLLVASDPWTQRVIEKIAGCLEKRRRCPKHTLQEMFAQRTLQIVAGYEDANDATTLRHDGLMQACVGRTPGPDAALASQPTLCRLENTVSRRELLKMFYAQIDLFMDSYAMEKAPQMLVLDLDPTACITYGQQELGFYNGHIGDYCLMPFHLYEGQSGKLIATVLRPGKTPTAAEILKLLRRVVRHIHKRWPRMRLMLRADSHHTKPEVLDWLESKGLDYALGYAPNDVLERECMDKITEARKAFQARVKAGDAQPEVRRFHSVSYKAGSWQQQRRVVARIAVTELGVDVRYIVTSFQEASAKALYDTVYCGRGNAELYIKAYKLDLAGDRLSCTSAMANQFRLFLHGAAYTVLHGFRRTVLAGTRLAKASFGQLRLKLIKVAARLDVCAKRLHLHLPWQLPAGDVIKDVIEQLRNRQATSACYWAT